MSIPRLVLAAILCGSAVAHAQNFEIPDWDNAVKFEVVASQKPVRPGDSFEVALVAYIEEGYHLFVTAPAEASEVCLTAYWTPAAPVHCAIRAGRLSMEWFSTRRAVS